MLARFIDALSSDASSLYPALLTTPPDFSWTRVEDEWKRITGETRREGWGQGRGQSQYQV